MFGFWTLSELNLKMSQKYLKVPNLLPTQRLKKQKIKDIELMYWGVRLIMNELKIENKPCGLTVFNIIRNNMNNHPHLN